MVGQAAGVVREVVGRRDFWRDPELNTSDCGSLVMIWADRHGRGGEFYDLREARPGDIIAFGTWGSPTFGIYLGSNKYATTAMKKDCAGNIKRKLVLVRIGTEAKQFVGGVHVG